MRVEGTARAGARLVVHMGVGGGHHTVFKPTVLAAEPGREFRLVGRLGIGGIVDGEHFFVVAAEADGTHPSDPRRKLFRRTGRAREAFDRGSLTKTHNGVRELQPGPQAVRGERPLHAMSTTRQLGGCSARRDGGDQRAGLADVARRLERERA